MESMKNDCNNSRNYNYVLVTPARNEEAFIEKTIKSVISQTIKPIKWVIVSDGSTDDTDNIVKKYADEYNWIELIRTQDRKERNFAGKVYAFNEGYKRFKDLKFDIIGNLDADISFDDKYIEYLLQKFSQNSQLGVAGTPFVEGKVSYYDFRFTRKEHVSGAFQLFRRECYDSVGGYIPLKAGAIDLVAVVTARMKGWHTETFMDKICVHHRPMGTAKYSIIKSNFRDGYYDYPMGVHPIWEIFRTVYNITRKPIIIAGVTHMAGYFWAMLNRVPKLVSDEFIRYRRKEQMKWLSEYFRIASNRIRSS